MTPEEEITILEGEPIEIYLLGQKRELKRMTFEKQREAIREFSKAATDLPAGNEVIDFVTDKMIRIVSIATGEPFETLSKNSNAAEIGVAFVKIRKQNGFDFLLDAMSSGSAGELANSASVQQAVQQILENQKK